MKKIYLTASLLLLATLCFAQTSKKDSLKSKLDSLFLKVNLNISGPSSNNYAPNFSPLTPNSASFQKHEDYQVNLATGVPDINIPLYTIQEGTLKSPIVLRYHAGGHTMSEFASWVGWGFNLDYGGGSLNRSIIGMADDINSTGSYLYNPITNRNLCDNSADYTFCSVVNAGNADLDPDLFSFSTHSSGGKFMLRHDDKPFLMPWQAVDINEEFNPDGTIKAFAVANPDGTNYHFGITAGGYGGTESQRVLGGSGVFTNNGITTWQIGQITSLTNENKISFQYQTGGRVSQVSQSWGANMTFDNLGTPITITSEPQSSNQVKDVEESNIYKIFFTNGEVEFVPSDPVTEPRTDIPVSPKLKEIKIYAYEGGVKTLLKSITFHYSYFKDRTGFDGRLKLESLQMFGIAGTTPQVYSFDYTTNSYSWKYDTGPSVTPNADWSKQDYFGYFNNKPNNHLIDIPSYNGVTILNGTANRATDETYVKEGLLNKITYPEGGYTTFDFEANRYKNLGVEVLGGGLRVKAIKHFDGLGNQASMKYYLYGSDAGDGIGKLNSVWNFPSSVNVGEYQFLSGTNVNKSVSIGSNGLAELSSHDGTPVYYTSVREYSEVITPIITPTVTNNAKSRRSFDNNTLSSSTNGYTDYTFSYEPDVIVNTPLSLTRDIEPWKRGLLLTKSVYKSDNTLLQKTMNTYDNFKLETIVNVAKVKYFNQATSFCNTCTSGMPYGFGAFGSVAQKQPLRPACANPQLIYFTGQNKTGQQKLIQTTERSYSGSSYVETVQNIQYDNYLQQSSMTWLSSKGETFKTIYTHPYDYTTSPYVSMTSYNYITPVIEETNLIDNVQTFKKSTDYFNLGGHFNPSKIRTKIGTGTEITPIVFDDYDSRGNLLKYTLRTGQTTQLTWYGTTGTDKGKTDLLKTQTVGGGVSGLVLGRTMSYDYFSLVGLKTMTDYNGYTTNYNFDGHQRLLNIKDSQGFLLKDFYYHYANQAALTGLGITPTNTLNYVISRTAREAQTGTALSNSVDNTTTQIQYMDGLGRGLQAQVWQGTPDKTKDLITQTSMYDVFGRGNKGILTTPSDDILGEYKSDAQTLAGTFYDDTYPYSETIFEPSPLNRPEKQFGAGQAWRMVGNEKFVTTQYLLAGNGIVQFNIQADGSISGATNYGNSTLFNNCVLSERGFQTYELKDKQGRVTHKFQQLQAGFTYAVTAYIYNDLNQLVAVISPEAYNKFGTGAGQITTLTETDAIYKELCYGYRYDNLGRLVEKKVAGAGWRYSVFNKNDVEVMFADESDLSKGYWQWRKVDALNREIQNGILNGIGSTTRVTLQNDFDSFTGQNYEEVGSTLLGYTNVSFPSTYAIADADVMSVRYHDNYDWKTETAYNFNGTTAFHAQGLAKGLLTGMLSKNLETNDWLKSVNYFDYRGKLIQSFFKNHKGNIERSETQYRFNGEVLKMVLEHEGINEVYDYEYNHLGAKTSFKHTLNGTLKNVAKYEHDDLGRLKTKKLSPVNSIGSAASGSWNNTNTWQNNFLPSVNDYIRINAGHIVTINSGEAGSEWSLYNAGTLNTYGQLKLGVLPPSTGGVSDLQVVDFSYHIRGSLRGINLDASGNLTNKLFSMKLGYEDAGYFDENIGKQEWKSNIDNVSRSFIYSYDGASRIKSGLFGSDNAGENYSLNNVNYDFNGNITNLSRNGWKSNNTFGLVDNLNYTYQSNSNKILKVDDGANETASFIDASGSTDYTYSLDGSLTSDANKGISLIEYNYLKKPRRIVKNGVEILYQYDATGRKLREIIGSNTTDYFGNIIKKNDVLYQISHDEGRIIDGEYEYNIKDHLGNLRVAFRDSLGIAKITQANSYGVFGNELRGLSFESNPATKNNFKFLGRESLPELGLVDLQKRWYDPVIGRFISVDPMPDVGGQESLSPYQYAWNNPVLLSDPDGDYPDGGGDDTQSEFFLARLVTTAFYDVKHAIFNTGARAVGSNYRASYATNSDGQEVFETKYAKAATPTTLKEVGKEVASGLLDVMVVSGVKAGPAGIGVLAESSETQTARGVRNVASTTLKDQATTIKTDLNAGKNSVTIKTTSGQTRYDLAGKAHAGVETPHSQKYKNNVVNGEVKSVTRESKNATSMTQQDIRTVKKYLEKNPQ